MRVPSRDTFTTDWLTEVGALSKSYFSRRAVALGAVLVTIGTNAHAQVSATSGQGTQTAQAAQTAQTGQTAQGATASTSVAAATPVDPREQEARSAFEAGVAALTDERYADALGHFQRSYEVRRAASAALNLGVTLRALGRLVEARQRFNEFLELASAAQHERHDREVATFIADISRRIGRVHIAVVDPAGARVLIDGRRAMLDEHDEIVVDPGEHRIEAVLAGYETALQTVNVSSGGRAEVQLRLQRPTQDLRVTPTPTTPTTGPSIWQSPAFWVIVGVGVTAAVAIPVTIAMMSGPDIPRLPGLFCIRTDGGMCPIQEASR